MESRLQDRSVAMRLPNQPVVTHVSWHLLASRSLQIAAGFSAAGVSAGDRVSVMMKPGPSRAAVAHACWRIGAVVCVASSELSRRDQFRAHEIATPTVVIADRPGLLITRALRGPELRIATDSWPLLDAPFMGVQYHLKNLVSRYMMSPLPSPPLPDDDAALVFVGTGEGPIGVFYTHHELGMVRDIALGQSAYADDGAAPTGPAPLAFLGSSVRTRSARIVAELLVPDMTETVRLSAIEQAG